MFRIVICEDEKAQREYLTGLIERWNVISGEKVSADAYTSAEQFLFETEGKATYDLLLLDIQMGHMNGVELARKVREQDTKVKIIFLTGIKDYAIEGYEVGAVRYLLKPVKEAVLFSLLDKLCEETKEQKEDYFLFQAGGVTNRVPYSEILYAEADGHYVVLKTACPEKKGQMKEWKWKENISSLSESLEAKGFFLFRRGLYVNLAKVEQIGKTECVLENGEVLPVSKARYQALNEAFIAYYKGE
ncbi:MAG: response regulator transcription factor [Lachnospiraceae bacterium]|nr:response regulator transcription factor [Lachnospiraceae bacterium]